MNLYNLLVHLPNEQLKRLAQEFGVSAMSPSQKNLTDAIAARYKDRSFLSLMFDELPEDCRALLQALVFFTPLNQAVLTIPEPFQRMRFRSVSFEESLSLLFDMGLLFHDSSGDADQVVLPPELRQALRSLFLDSYSELKPLRELPLETVRAGQDGVEAVFHLLGILLHYRAPQTRKGSIHKKIVERWRDRFAGIGLDEDFFQFAFDFCLDQELLTVHHGNYRPSPKVSDWLCKAPLKLRDEVWRYFLHTRVLKESGLQRLLVVLHGTWKSVCRKKTSPVFSIQSLEEILTQDKDSSDSASWPVLNGLQWLEYLGIVHIERVRELSGVERPDVFSLTGIGADILFDEAISEREESRPHHAVLQPNFDLLVPSAVDYLSLWKLEKLAEFRRRDVMSEYHLSQHSIIFAMRRGWSQDEVFGFIGELISGPIPDNVRYSLEAWCGMYGQITLRRTVLIECVSPELADEMIHVPGVRPMIEERIADRYFTVTESNAKPLMRLLQDRGYEPAAKRLTGEE